MLCPKPATAADITDRAKQRCLVASRDQGKYNYDAVRRWTMEKRLKQWGQVCP